MDKKKEKVRRWCVDKKIATKLVAIYLASLTLAQNFGGTSGGRTHDKRIKSPLLYQLSYGPITLGIQRLFRTLRSLKV